MNEDGVKYEYLDGSTKDRAERVDNFQRDDGPPVFLISLKAGGSGLNLTAADTVIHFDPWWNPAVEDQATDRAHRIGQTKVVTTYRLIAKGTIEEKILELGGKKRELVGAVLSEDVGRREEAHQERSRGSVPGRRLTRSGPSHSGRGWGRLAHHASGFPTRRCSASATSSVSEASALPIALRGAVTPEVAEGLTIVAEYGALTEAMYLMMSADGQVTNDEREVLRGALRALSTDTIRSAHIESLLDSAAKQMAEHGREKRMAEVVAQLRDDPARAEVAFVLAAAIAFADNAIADEENETLNTLAEGLGIDEERATALLDSVEADLAAGGQV